MFRPRFHLNLTVPLLILLLFQISFSQDNQIRLNAEKLQVEADELAKKATPESQAEAKKKYLESLSVWESLNEVEKQALTLHKLVELSYLTSDLKKSLEYSQKALPLFQKSGNRTMEAETLSNLGGFLDAVGQSQEAVSYLFKALEIVKELNDKKRLAIVLNTIGLVYSNTGEMRKAIEYLQQSLILRREVADKAGEARTLINLGTIYDDTGENRRAAEYYEQGLANAIEQKDLRTQAVALNNLGFVWHNLGEYQKAFDYYQKALGVRRQADDRRGEATTLNNIGTILETVGDIQSAKEYIERALQIYQELGLKRNEARSYNSLGAIYSQIDDEKKALEYYQKSLEINRSIANKNGQANVLRNIALIKNGQENFDESLQLLQEALKLAEEIEDAEIIADILTPLGQTFDAKKDLKQAEASFIRAIKIQRESELKEDLPETFYHYSQFLQRVGRQPQAIENMREVIEIIEDSRNAFTSQSSRTSFLAKSQKYYAFYIQLLIDNHQKEPTKGFDKLALTVSESARARSLLDSLGELRKDIRGQISPELLEEERILRQTINAKETQRLDAVRQKLTAKATEFEKEITVVLHQYQNLQTKIRQSNPQFASLVNPEPLNLEEIQNQVLDEETVLLEYFLGEERSFLFFASKNNLEIFELPSQTLIDAQVRQTLENLKSRAESVENETALQRTERLKKSDLNADKNLAETGKILLAPIADKIAKKRLVIVASGVLQYLPFAALKIPNSKSLIPNSTVGMKYLIETNEIISLPSASMLPLLRQIPKGEKTNLNKLAILADPVFSEDDVRFKALNKPPSTQNPSPIMRAAQIIAPSLRSGFSRLRFSRIEADAISELANSNQRFVALDFAANLKSANSENLQNSQIVHFATHGIVNSQFPELSGIVLSLVDEKGNKQEGFLRVHDVYNLRLRADLVVLSACETALGKEVKGEGIVGLTRGFMFAGVPTVAASLWRVEDQATADLMKRFYQRMMLEKMPPAAALRQAQISMLKEKSSAQPFYWAGFTLQGDWKAESKK